MEFPSSYSKADQTQEEIVPEDDYEPSLLTPEDITAEETIDLRKFAMEMALKSLGVGVPPPQMIEAASIIEKWMMTGEA